MWWDDLNARARGYASHLLSDRARRELASVTDLAVLRRRFAELGVELPPGDGPTTETGLDRAVASRLAGGLSLLARWAGAKRTAVLGVVYGRLELQALRALLRGAAAGVPPEARLRGITPTPRLPERVLRRLSGAAGVDGMVEQLAALGYPAARAVADRRGALGLFSLEILLTQGYASRAVRAARRGGRPMRRFTAWTIDLDNAGSVLLADKWNQGAGIEEVFLPGGLVLPLETFGDLCSSSPEHRRVRLSVLFASTPYAGVFPTAGEAVPAERDVLDARRRWLKHVTRVDPLGVSTLLRVVNAMEVEAHDLRAITWGLALGAPPDRVHAELLAAA